MNSQRSQFLLMVAISEGSLLLIAAVIHLLAPLPEAVAATEATCWKLNMTSVIVGGLGTLPLIAALLLALQASWPAFQRIQDLLDEILGPSLHACRWYDLLWVSALAGIAEEALFRGVLQPRLGIWITSGIFGLLHPVTPTYTLLAAGIGLYLGWLFEFSHNLWGVALTHGLYDFVAFLIVTRRLSIRKMLPRNQE